MRGPSFAIFSTLLLRVFSRFYRMKPLVYYRSLALKLYHNKPSYQCCPEQSTKRLEFMTMHINTVCKYLVAQSCVFTRTSCVYHQCSCKNERVLFFPFSQTPLCGSLSFICFPFVYFQVLNS